MQEALYRQQIPRILWKPEVHYRTSNSPPTGLYSESNQFSLLHTLFQQDALRNYHPIYTLVSQVGFLLHAFRPKLLYGYLPLLCVLHSLSVSSSIDLIITSVSDSHLRQHCNDLLCRSCLSYYLKELFKFNALTLRDIVTSYLTAGATTGSARAGLSKFREGISKGSIRGRDRKYTNYEDSYYIIILYYI